MSSPIGMAEYFAMEAGEYLERLNALVSREGSPPAEDLVRYSRALRGSALMAAQPLVARTAAGLEAVAKAYREGRRPWDDSLRERCVRAVAELRALVKTAGSWTDDENTRAERLAQDLESLGGVASPGGPRNTPVPSGAPGTDSGVRAYVAREGALAAGALDRAARALRSTPSAHEPLYAVLRRLQSLRGLAALPDLAPLPDLLDSVERAVGELTRMFAPPPRVADVFEAAAQALTRGARDIAQTGRATPDAEEGRRFADLLLRAFATESDVVPIESLFEDRGGGLLQAGTALRGNPLGTMELVSHGERLCEVADELERATSPTVKDLRLYAAVAAIRPLETAVGAQVPQSLAAFAGAARELIAAGGAAQSIAEFAACVRDAGAVLRGLAAPSNGPHPSDRIEALAQRLHRMGAPVFRPVQQLPLEAEPVAMPLDEGDIVPIERLAPDVVPIESLGPEKPSTPPPRRSAPSIQSATDPIPASQPLDEPGLAGSYVTLDRLIRARGRGAPSLHELLQGNGVADQPAEIPSDGEIIAIEALCYHGRGALDRATVLRKEVDAILLAGTDFARVRPLLDELLDLVSLAAETT